MSDETLTRLERTLMRHEGVRLKPYKDSVGKLTIGVGRNLTDRGISEDEALHLFRNDIALHAAELYREFPWVVELDALRQEVLVNMAFNMGIPTLSQFRRTMGSIKEGNYELAASQMLESRWASQVGRRAVELSEMMRTGRYTLST